MTAQTDTCARLHPTLPSELEISVVHKNNGTTYRRRICTRCRSVITASQPRNGKTFGGQSPPAKKNYGVIKLSWIPTEMLMMEESTAAGQGRARRGGVRSGLAGPGTGPNGSIINRE